MSEKPGRMKNLAISVGSWIRHRVRYLVAIVTFFTIGSVMSAVDIFTYTMVYMEKRNDSMNATDEGIRIYNEDEKSWLIMAMAIGNLIGIYPSSLLFQNFGARYVLFGACIICAAATALIPVTLDNSFPLAIVMRIIQGIAFAADCSVVGLVASQWAPLGELGIFLAILGSFTALKSFVALPLSGYLVPKYDWRAPHYALAAIVFVMAFIWLLVYRDHPADIKCVSNKELEAIRRDKSEAQNQMRIKKVLKCPQVWGIWISAFADTYSSFVFSLYTPTFFAVLGYTKSEVAMYAAFQGYAFLLLKIVTGFATDWITCVSDLTKLRFFSMTSLQAAAICLLVVAFLPISQADLIVALTTLLVAFVGTNVGGFYRGAAMVSRQFAHFVLGVVQVSKALSVLLIPPLFRACVPNNEYSEYRLFFLINVGFLTVGNIVFLIFASAKPAKFVLEASEEVEETNDEDKEQSLPSLMSTKDD